MGPRRARRRALLLAAFGVAALGALVVLWRASDSGEFADDSRNSDEHVGRTNAALAAGGRTPERPPTPERTWEPEIEEPKGPVSSEPSPEAIVGVVLNEDGTPASGRVVTPSLGSLDLAETPPTLPEDPDTRPHRTDAQGRFRFEPMPSRGVTLAVFDDPLLVGGPIAARSGEPVTIRLRARPWVVVTVTDASGKPVAGMTVRTSIPEDGGDGRAAKELDVSPKDLARLSYLFEEPQSLGRMPWRQAHAYCEATTDSQGRARIAPILREHPCRIEVMPTHRSQREHYERTIDPWVPKDETIALPRARPIEGTVRDLRGEAVTEGEIRWEGAGATVGVARVEYDGTFLIDRVPDGLVTLEFSMPGAPLPVNAGRVTVSAGDESARVVVDLGADLDVTIEKWPRVPGGVVHATREPRDAGEKPERATADIDADGHARLRGLRGDATYTLFVAPTIEALQGEGAWRHAIREHAKPGGTPVTLTLADGEAIAGRVKPPPGDGWSHRLIIEDRGVVLLTTPSEGHFEFRGLPAGAYRVRAFAFKAWEGPGSPVFVGESVLRTGTTDAALTLLRAPEGTQVPGWPR